jgi:hypothetical protein
VKHKKIFEQVYKLTMAAVHGDGTLVGVVCDTALGAISLSGIQRGVIGWDFFRFLHFVIIFSSQPETDVINVIDMLAQYRRLVHTI